MAVELYDAKRCAGVGAVYWSDEEGAELDRVSAERVRKANCL
jgi:hypothetical protein